MTDAEKARKRTRENFKKEVRARYRHLMRLAKYNIKNATHNHCVMKRMVNCQKTKVEFGYILVMMVNSFIIDFGVVAAGGSI